MAETHPDKAALLKDALRNVLDPEMGYSVIDLGLIRNASLNEYRLLITMIMTTPFCPYAPQMVENVRTCAETALNGIPVAIDLRMDLWDESMMEADIDLGWGMWD